MLPNKQLIHAEITSAGALDRLWHAPSNDTTYCPSALLLTKDQGTSKNVCARQWLVLDGDGDGGSLVG